ncbi:MAG: primosomal protein N' (replication factor Y) - superfamily II helicase [Planctomycetes bacterium]|nr:primosomal protein N' (replication factor Y) - superfamily II helicase [Planctomycetota bacterium]
MSAPQDSPTPPVEGQNVRFRCPNCGAALRWDPDADALHCDHCGKTIAVPRLEGTIVEHPLEEASSAPVGLELEVRVARCTECGAQVAYDANATAEQCCFCGSPQVLEQSANRHALRPESLIPLDVGRATVEQGFRKWISSLWFRPSALARTREFQAVGVYVPYWTFDASVDAKWSADAGYYYYVPVTHTAMVNGRMVTQTRMERRVRWEPAWGERHDDYDDVLVHASRGLSAALAAKLGAWDMRALVRYRPEYLAGWRAEEYSVDLEQGWKNGLATIEGLERERCSGDVPGDTQRDLRVQNTVSGVRWKHLLLPMWSLTYRFGGKNYAVLIHGQTGKVVGEAPLSWIKILGFTLLVLALVAAGLAILASASS